MPAAYLRLRRGRRYSSNFLPTWDPGAIGMARSLAGAFTLPMATLAVERLFQQSQTRRDSLATESTSRDLRITDVPPHDFYLEISGHAPHAGVGLFYSRGRRGGAALCAHWRAVLTGSAPLSAIQQVNPCAAGVAGLTSHLRLRYPGSVYVGIDLEINRKIVLAAGRAWMTLRRALVESLRNATLQGFSPIQNGRARHQQLRFYARQMEIDSGLLLNKGDEVSD